MDGLFSDKIYLHLLPLNSSRVTEETGPGEKPQHPPDDHDKIYKNRKITAFLAVTWGCSSLVAIAAVLRLQV